jgi:hypothetical protein
MSLFVNPPRTLERRSCMTRSVSALVPLVVVAGLATAALVGCTPTPAGPPATSTAASSTPSPVVTPAAADTAPPRPALDVDCSGLAPAAAITAAFGAGVHSVDPLISQLLTAPTVPDAYVLQTLGGLSCEWNNGVPYLGSPGSTLYAGVQLALLPHAASQWAKYAAIYGSSGEGVFCPADPHDYCESEQLVGTTWVALWMYGAGSEAQADALAASIAAAVTAAAPGAPAWTPPSGTGTIGGCSTLLTPARAQADMAVTGTTIVFAHAGGGWSIQSGARENADAVGCLYGYADEESVPAEVGWLRGGEWAYDAAAAHPVSGWGAITPAAIPGLAPDDRARIRCTDATAPDYEGFAICTVDLALGGNWIQVVYEPEAGGRATAEPRAGALALAADVVAGYHAG